MIKIVGLGTEKGDLTFNAFNALKSSRNVILRTGESSNAAFLNENNINFKTLDYIYETSKDFDELNECLAKEIEFKHSETGDVCYAVDGDGFSDNSVKILCGRNDIEIITGVSRPLSSLGKVLETGYSKKFSSSYEVICLYDFLDEEYIIDGLRTVVITDLDNLGLVSELKLKLFDFYDEEKDVFIISEKVEKVKLYEIDHLEKYDYSTVLVLESEELVNKKRFSINDLISIIRILRGENGCEWDKAQDHQSIKMNLIEEAYELLEAIELCDDDKMREEAGDVLLQVIFHSEMANERGEFTFTDVLSELCQKLIFRHSHIFGTDKVSSADGDFNLGQKQG